jgi:DNA polymerase-3 subunit gamma/tau
LQMCSAAGSGNLSRDPSWDERKNTLPSLTAKEDKKTIQAKPEKPVPTPPATPPVNATPSDPVNVPTVKIRTISIKPENHKDSNGQAKGEQHPLNPDKEEFSQERLEKVWVYYTESIARQYPNFYSILGTRKPLLKEDFRISVSLDNKAQEMTWNERKADLLDFLRSELRNQLIQVEALLSQSETELKPFTSDEKYRAMVQKNPLVKELKDKLEMDLEY